MHILDLNRDVFLYIFSFVDRRSLTEFSITCRNAHVATIQLLRSSIELCGGQAQIVRLCEYLLRHPTRIPLIRRLEIDLDTRQGSDVSCCRLLTEVLKRAHNLQHLYMCGLWAQPEVASAIVRCPRLAVLRLSGEELTPQLESIARIGEIGGLRVLCLRLDLDSEFKITPLIRRSKSTFESLYLTVWVHFGNGITLHLDRTECWPRLRVLDICGPHGIPTRTLSSAFPNLRVLRFSLDHGEVSETNLYMRTINERDALSWPTLDYVCGTVPDVYSLALSSHIRELELSYMDDAPLRPLQEQILDITQHTQPLALTLKGKPTRPSKSFFLRFANYARRLQYLEVDGWSFDEFNMRGLESLQIAYLSYIARRDAAEDYFPLASRMFNSLPSVRYIEITTDPGPSRPSFAWYPRERTWGSHWEVIRAKSVGEKPVVQQISRDRALWIKQPWVGIRETPSGWPFSYY